MTSLSVSSEGWCVEHPHPSMQRKLLLLDILSLLAVYLILNGITGMLSIAGCFC